MEKWLIIFFVFVAIGITVYAVNSFSYTMSEDKQEETQANIDNKTDLILLQINKSLDILLAGQNIRHSEHDEIIDLIKNLTK